MAKFFYTGRACLELLGKSGGHFFQEFTTKNGKESFLFDLKPRQLKQVVAEIVHGNKKMT